MNNGGSRAPSTYCYFRVAWDVLRLTACLAVFCVLGLLWSMVAIPLYYLLPRRTGLIFGRALIHNAFRLYMRMLTIVGVCRFDLSALDVLRGQSPMIVAPNHPSLLDAVTVLSRVPGMACIMKAKIVNNVFVGAGARLARYIENDAPRRMIQLAVADLRTGHHLLLFPEGTRTTRLPIGPVRGSIGLIAKHAQVPVQAVFIETDSALFAKGWPRLCNLHLPISYCVRLGRRFDPPQNVRAFVIELEAYFMDAMADTRLLRYPPKTARND
ncbi:MAG: 1-acyl-sn-glycerol-3-phosphate acyltransferase [Chromatiales bacterium 21-64-14]|nr:MAG: 1-acyl-sn-glycerol-3-phosphate acyltransferase [Chromatiales bacterium 21-64-14]HQU14644.1 lysophospholipid acyltransferase family protein [Gammaproteobacteria bacterium]